MKKKGLKIVVMFLIVALLSVSFAPIATYATSKTATRTTSSSAVRTLNNTATTRRTNTTSNASTTVNKSAAGTKQSASNAVSRIMTNTAVNRSKAATSTTTMQSTALNRVYETVKRNTEKVVEETIAKNNGLEGIETSLESKIYKNFGEIENIEVDSKVVYTICIKNTTNQPKTVQLKATMPESVLSSKTVAKIADVDNNVIDSEVDRGYINTQIVSYKGLINVNLAANGEKAIIIEQDITKYNIPELTTAFAVVCDGSVRNLRDTKRALTPARINAEMKLYVNDNEIENGKTVALNDNDIAKYIITVVNSGETAEALNIKDSLPKAFTIKNVEYINNDKRTVLADGHDGSTLNTGIIELKQNETMQIALTIEPNINGELNISNFAEISGTHIKDLNTNTLENTFVCNKTAVKGVVIKDEAFKKENPTKGGTEDTNTILNHFINSGLNMKFPAYADYNGTQLNEYGYQNIDANFYIPMKGNALFRKTKDMFCLNMGHSYYRDLKIENFYTVYNEDLYRYINGELQKGQLPSSGIGIGSSYNNLLNEHYNELAFILSQIDSNEFGKAFYNTLGINYDTSWDRPDHGVSPVQVAIWRLEGATNTQLINRIRTRLSGTMNITNTAKQNEIINKVMERSATLSAYAKAYDNYISNIGREPVIEFTNSNPIEVNGRTLVGPFKITYPSLGTGGQQYMDVAGNTHTKYGVYGEIRKIEITNTNTKYEKIYNADGSEITIGNTIANPIEFYIDIKGKNFNIANETNVDVQINNQARNAYIYTLKSRTYDNGQHVLIGRGTASLKTYQLKIPGIVIEKINLSGIVWKDGQHGEKSPVITPKEPQGANGILDDDEEGIPGIKVSLLDNNKHEIVAETTTNDQGRYAFNNIEKSNYSILFAFEGINYEVSKAVEGETNPTRTKVEEKADGRNLRVLFNDRFINIRKDKHIIEQFVLEPNGIISVGTTDHTMSYETTQGLSGYKSKLITTDANGNIIPGYKMYAKTVETYDKTTDNINMGLKIRRGDLSLSMKANAETILSNYRKIRTRERANSNIEYIVELHNEESGLVAAFVHEVDFYYDPGLEFVEAEYRYKNMSGNEDVESRLTAIQDGEITIEGKTYKKMHVRMIEGFIWNHTNEIHLQFKPNGNISGKTLKAYSEISEYTMVEGRIDKDSQPGNGINADGTILKEDDFDSIDINTIRNQIIRTVFRWMLVNP